MANEPNFESSPSLDDELVAERRALSLSREMPPRMARVVYAIDKFSAAVGRVVCWLVVPVFAAMVAEVVMSKFFTPTLWAFDISRMLYGAMFMLGAGYALMRGVHIRADFLYRLWSPRTQGTVDFFLYLFLYFPGMLLFFWISAEYALEAFGKKEFGENMERLDDTAWRPLAGPARAAMPVGAFLLLLQGVSELLKSYFTMTRGRRP